MFSCRNHVPCCPGKVNYHEITFSLRNNQGNYLRCSFSELFGYYFSTTDEMRTLPWQLDLAAAADVEQHLRENPNLTKIAKFAGVAPEYLCREFKRATGYSQIVYRDIQRIVAAKKMLRYSERSIKELAELLGFADVYYFPQVFKKIAGTPPGKYRSHSFDQS